MTPQIIVMGTSMGGLRALETLFAGLNRQFSLPIAVVQHRGKSTRDMLSTLLQKYTTLTVKDAEDKESLKAAHIYVAPSDYHLLLDKGYCSLSLEAPLNYARPSVDILFESAAFTYGAAAIAVVLTGSNADGARGAACIKKAGGTVIVQAPEDSECDMMPRATLKIVRADFVLKLSEIAPCLINCCRTAEV